MSNGCPVVMKTTLKPRSATRWISATVSSTSSSGSVAAHTNRGDWRWNSIAQSLSTLAPSRTSFGSRIENAHVASDG